MNFATYLESLGFSPASVVEVPFNGSLHKIYREERCFDNLVDAERYSLSFRRKKHAKTCSFYVGSYLMEQNGYPVYSIEGIKEFDILGVTLAQAGETMGEEMLDEEARVLAADIYSIQRYFVFYCDKYAIRAEFEERITENNADVISQLLMDKYPYLIGLINSSNPSMADYVTKSNKFFITTIV